MNIEFLGAHDNLAVICGAAGVREGFRETIKQNRRNNLSRHWPLQLSTCVKNRLCIFFTIKLHQLFPFSSLYELLSNYLSFSNEHKGCPIEWIRISETNCLHCLLKRSRPGGARPPLFVEFLHKSHG